MMPQPLLLMLPPPMLPLTPTTHKLCTIPPVPFKLHKPDKSIHWGCQLELTFARFHHFPPFCHHFQPFPPFSNGGTVTTISTISTIPHGSTFYGYRSVELTFLHGMFLYSLCSLLVSVPSCLSPLLLFHVPGLLGKSLHLLPSFPETHPYV